MVNFIIPDITPEELDEIQFGDGVVIPDAKKKEAFPVPWGFLLGWWIWGLSYIFPLDGSVNVNPTGYGIAALIGKIFALPTCWASFKLAKCKEH